MQLLCALFFLGRFLVIPSDWSTSLRGRHVATLAAPRPVCLDLYERRSLLRRFNQRGSGDSECMCRRQRRQAAACDKKSSNEAFHSVSPLVDAAAARDYWTARIRENC